MLSFSLSALKCFLYVMLSSSELDHSPRPIKKKNGWALLLGIGILHTKFEVIKTIYKKKLETVIAQSSNLVWLFTDKVDEVRMTNALQNSSSRNIYQEQLFV